jgi:hypothetical protein
MNNKRWSDFSRKQRVSIVFLGTIQIGLLAMALWDLARRSAEELRGSKRMWAGLVFINWIGPLAYFAIGRKDGLCSRYCSCCTPSKA